MRRSVLGIVTLVGLATSFTTVPSAQAQPANVDKEKAKTAKQYVDAGLAAQNAKDYDTAVTLYTKAYELVPHPVLLFNVAQAHRLAGRIDEALKFYDRYLATDPNGPQAKTARDLVAEINGKRAADAKKLEDARKAEEARKAEARKAEQARKADDARKLEDAKRLEDERQAEQLPSAEEDRGSGVARPGRSLRIAGIAAGGAGVVAVGVSIAFGLRARSISDELSQPGAPYDPKRISDGEAAERNAIFAGVAGGVLIAGGVALYYLGHRARNATPREEVTLLLGSSLVGVALSGAWP